MCMSYIHIPGFFSLLFTSLSLSHVIFYFILILVIMNLQEVEVNLIITDYCMPGMTGYDLLRKIKVIYALFSISLCLFPHSSLYSPRFSSAFPHSDFPTDPNMEIARSGLVS